MPRISVIATFYNTEAFVQRCVDSLLKQTFDDYELILVDDGSRDGTAAVLDQFLGNKRVRVYHQKNGGTSRARNFGVRRASGELITFVDGDDFVSPRYLECLFDLMSQTNSDLAVGGHMVVTEKVAAHVTWPSASSPSPITYDQGQLVRALLYERVTEAPWGKLARRELYLRQPFPPGRMYEDVAVAGRHCLSLHRVAHTETPLYAYLMREGSVVHRRHASAGQVNDFHWAIDQFLGPLRSSYPGLREATCYREALELLRLHTLMTTLTKADADRLRGLSDETMMRLQSLNSIVRRDPDAPRHTKIRLGILCASPRLYDVLFAFYERHIKGIARTS